MECTLATLITCFSLSNLYVDTGIQIQDSGIGNQVTVQGYELRQSEWVMTYEESIFREETDNPYGRFGLGYSLDFGSVQVEIEAMHTSSLALGEDKGINALSLRMRWFPFR